MKKAVGFVLGFFLVLAGVLIPATAASAAGVQQCASSAQLGKICITPISNGNYNATYNNYSNGARYVDFNLRVRGMSNPIGDQGAFTIIRGGSASYVFAIRQPAACVSLVLYDRTGAYPPLSTAFTC